MATKKIVDLLEDYNPNPPPDRIGNVAVLIGFGIILLAAALVVAPAIASLLHG